MHEMQVDVDQVGFASGALAGTAGDDVLLPHLFGHGAWLCHSRSPFDKHPVRDPGWERGGGCTSFSDMRGRMRRETFRSGGYPVVDFPTSETLVSFYETA
ncbi:hypothetical protein GCM10023319_29200 [Nocardia iowensis]